MTVLLFTRKFLLAFFLHNQVVLVVDVLIIHERVFLRNCSRQNLTHSFFTSKFFFAIILVRTERIYFSRKVFLAIAVVITWRISFFRASFSWKFQSSIPKAVIIHELVFLETLPLPFYYMTHSSCTSKFFSAGAVVKNWRFSNSRGRLFGNCTCQKGKSSKSNLASKTFVQHSHWHCHFETRWETWPLTCDYSAKENYWWTNL